MIGNGRARGRLGRPPRERREGCRRDATPVLHVTCLALLFRWHLLRRTFLPFGMGNARGVQRAVPRPTRPCESPGGQPGFSGSVCALGHITPHPAADLSCPFLQPCVSSQKFL